MKEILKTEELYIEVEERQNDAFALNIYHNVDDDLFIEAYLSRRELDQLIKTLTRVHLVLKPY